MNGNFQGHNLLYTLKIEHISAAGNRCERKSDDAKNQHKADHTPQIVDSPVSIDIFARSVFPVQHFAHRFRVRSVGLNYNRTCVRCQAILQNFFFFIGFAT